MSPAGPGWSDGHGGKSEDKIIAQGGHGFQGHVAGALDSPFVVLLQKDGSDQADDGGVVGKDADDVGAAFDLTVEPFEAVCNRYESRRRRSSGCSEESAAYGATIRDRGAGSTKCGQADLFDEPRARVSSWPPLRLARLRRERESVGVVSPTAPVRTERRREMRRVIGIDIHRTFGEVVTWEDGKLRNLGRVEMTRTALEGLGGKLLPTDEAVIEATGNCMAVSRVLSTFVRRVVIANPLQVKAIAHARVKTDKVDAGALASLFADLFDMQDEIVARLAGALNTELVAAEARRAEKVPNPESMDLYFQGLAWFNKGFTPDNVAQARCFFDRALSNDPDNVEALVGSARADAISGVLVFVADSAAAFFAAETKLTKALSSVPDHARDHMLLGYVEILTKRAARGIAECEHALALDRNLGQAQAYVGFGKIYVGRAEEAEAHIIEAIRWLTTG